VFGVLLDPSGTHSGTARPTDVSNLERRACVSMDNDSKLECICNKFSEQFS